MCARDKIMYLDMVYNFYLKHVNIWKVFNQNKDKEK